MSQIAETENLALLEKVGQYNSLSLIVNNYVISCSVDLARSRR